MAGSVANQVATAKTEAIAAAKTAAATDAATKASAAKTEAIAAAKTETETQVKALADTTVKTNTDNITANATSITANTNDIAKRKVTDNGNGTADISDGTHTVQVYTIEQAQAVAQNKADAAKAAAIAEAHTKAEAAKTAAIAAAATETATLVAALETGAVADVQKKANRTRQMVKKVNAHLGLGGQRGTAAKAANTVVLSASRALTTTGTAADSADTTATDAIAGAAVVLSDAKAAIERADGVEAIAATNTETVLKGGTGTTISNLARPRQRRSRGHWPKWCQLPNHHVRRRGQQQRRIHRHTG